MVGRALDAGAPPPQAATASKRDKERADGVIAADASARRGRLRAADWREVKERAARVVQRSGRVQSDPKNLQRCSKILAFALIAGCNAPPSASPIRDPFPRHPGADTPADRAGNLAGDLFYAPPDFPVDDGTAAFIDIDTVELALTFDVEADTATGRATIQFVTGAEGQPLLDLVPSPTFVSLDGDELDPSSFAEQADPDGVTTFRIVRRELAAETWHTLVIEYPLPQSDADVIDFGTDTVTVRLEGGDLDDRDFWERFAPSNMEYDRYRQTIDVAITNTEAEHVVLTNGDIEEPQAGQFHVEYPSHFVTSSFLFYMLPARAIISTDTSYQSTDGRVVPVRVFTETDNSNAEGVAHIVEETLETLAELEGYYGPYPHPALLVGYEPEPEDDGMEFTGATITSEGALEHELLHQWFARSAAPVNGNAGFVDEAIARWGDNDYVRAQTSPADSTREPINVAAHSVYRRATDRESYDAGSALLSEIDFALADEGGLRPVLRQFYERYAHSPITVGDFQRFLVENTTGVDIDAAFERFVYGREQ